MNSLASALRIEIWPNTPASSVSEQILSTVNGNSEMYLDCLDATLYLKQNSTAAKALAELLELGGSVWTVNVDGTALERRVSDEAAAAYKSVINEGGSVAEELREAWAAAFGRSPDPSDAWDHAIKAVEETLIPIVVPKVAKANLGSVAGELKSHPEKWNFGLEAHGARGNGETLEGLIRHIWPNPDRHGGGVARRVPTQGEAESVVHIAVLIVTLCLGRLVKA